MVISFEHRFIFVHVFKVAGTSVKDALEPYAHKPRHELGYRVLRRLGLVEKLPFDTFKPLPHRHAMARAIQEYYTKKTYDNFYKFAFVRNPWDWQVSLYHYMLRMPNHKEHDIIKEIPDFDAYIDWRVSRTNKLQKDFVTDAEGREIVDFIGRFETLNDDFASVCEHLGLQARLPHLNQSKRRDYRSYYTDKTAALIAEHFHEDIAYFGYTFDPVSSEA